jgi:ABC-type uncharacterized transport system permease subunit
MLGSIFLALLAGAVIVQAYVSFRVIDHWNLSLRRERVLVAALDARDLQTAQAAHAAIIAEIDAQTVYQRKRWFWQRSPRWPKPWPG